MLIRLKRSGKTPDRQGNLGWTLVERRTLRVGGLAAEARLSPQQTGPQALGGRGRWGQ